MIMHCIPLALCQCFMLLLDVCLIIDVSVVRFGLGFTNDALKFSCHMFMHFSFIHTSHILFLWSEIVFLFCLLSLSLSLSLSNRISLWHPNKENPFRLETFFKVPGHPFCLFFLFHLTSSSMMRRLRQTSLRTSRLGAFIQNARSFYQISLTLCYSMSFELVDRNLYVRNPCIVMSCLYRSSTPTYTTLIPLCLNSLCNSKVHI